MTGPPPDPEAWTDAEREEEDLRATVRRLEARLRRADAKVADLLDAVYAAARDGMASVEAGTGDPLTNYVLGFLTAATLRPDYLAMLQSIP